MYNTKLIIFGIEMHLEGARSTTYLDIALKGTRQLLKSEQ
jgi:hypothetical protein